MPPSPVMSPGRPCCACERHIKTWTCVQCNNEAFCDECWGKERPHKPGAVGIDGRPHEKVDVEVVARLTRIFGDSRSPAEQEALHVSDIDTTWFGVMKGANQPVLHYSHRLLDIMRESQTGQYPERFPHLVSFVGQTGAGKSTVIKMLIDREQAQTNNRPLGLDSFPTPVTGLINDIVPTTGDVHLYSDPATYYGQRPTLYADCEGMSGGEKLPMGVACKEKIEAAKANTRMAKSKFRKPLVWASGPKQSREFSVKRLYPRILYTFSDVIVFVLREARVFQTEVLQKLIEWAYTSIDKSINQPNLPHIIIVLNATENAIDEKQWDLDVATQKLLNDYKDSVHQVQKLQNIVASLKTIGKDITSTKDLLEYYYSSITVVRIPTKGRYMQIDEQVGKLYDVIKQKCLLSYSHKKAVRMLLNAERLQQYVNSAYDHFSRRLDEPFDFVKEALRHNPMPQDFRGHILNLMLALYHEEDGPDPSRPAKKLLWLLCRPIASCVMLAAAREDLQGAYQTLLWNTFYTPIKAAFDDFCDKWLRCSFESGGDFCRNVKNSHKKGHQASSGKIFAKGPYVPEFPSESFFEDWMKEIANHLEKLIEKLQKYGADGAERELVSRLHRQEIETYFPKLGSTAKFSSHATCFCCVRKIPQHVLPCGHVLCKSCVQSFGTRVGESVYEMRFCPLHPDQTKWINNPARIRYKPRGAGVRVLCLDGGGVRGIIELVILRAIEKELGGHIPVQNFFDLIVGTSTGGIIALGLGVKNWRVADCMTQFKNLVSEAFTARPLKRLALVSHKSYYKTKPLEAAFSLAFDPDALLFGGTSQEERSQINVAVTSTAAAENRPVVMTNYNTAGPGRDNLPYQFVRQPDPKAEVKIWEAARATSAAPLYFKPFIKEETAVAYTDGAIHYNCPAWVAHHECQVLWEDVRNREPDLFLSMGTGLGSQPGGHNKDIAAEIKKAEKLHQRRTTSGFAYMWRTAYGIIDSQLNCESTWRDFIGKTRRVTLGRTMTPESARRYMRINVELKDGRPNLDQVDQVQGLEKQAFYSANRNPDIKEVAHRLIASSFYFEREGGFHQEHGTYSCHGAISCRFEKGSRDLKGLGKFLTNCLKGDFEPSFFIQENYGTAEETQQEIAISGETLTDMCNRGVFDLHTPIRVQSVHQSNLTRISLCLQEVNYLNAVASGPATYSERYLSISGFPRELFTSEIHKPLPSLPTKVKRSITSTVSPTSPITSPKTILLERSSTHPARVGSPSDITTPDKDEPLALKVLRQATDTFRSSRRISNNNALTGHTTRPKSDDSNNSNGSNASNSSLLAAQVNQSQAHPQTQIPSPPPKPPPHHLQHLQPHTSIPVRHHHDHRQQQHQLRRARQSIEHGAAGGGVAGLKISRPIAVTGSGEVLTAVPELGKGRELGAVAELGGVAAGVVVGVGLGAGYGIEEVVDKRLGMVGVEVEGEVKELAVGVDVREIRIEEDDEREEEEEFHEVEIAVSEIDGVSELDGGSF